MGRKQLDMMQHLKTIESLAAFGLSKEKIANSLGCHVRTLNRRLDDNPYVFLAYEIGKKKRQELWK